MARPRTHDDAVRRRLLESASRAISRGGPAGLSVRAVAAEAGTTTAAVYSLFGSRDGLVGAVVEEGFRRFAEQLADVRRTADPMADLLALGLAYRRSALTEPHFYRVMFAPAPDTGGGAAGGGHHGRGSREAVGRPTFAVLRSAVERALGSGEGATWDAEEIAVRLWSLTHGLVSLELAGLLPGDAAEREARYRDALRTARW